MEKERVYQEQPVLAPTAKPRRAARIRIQIPMFVRGKNQQGDAFLELGKTLNVSSTGVLLVSSRQFGIDDILTLTIPAPAMASSGLVPSGMPPISARVKRVQKSGDVHLVGAEFLKPLD